MSIQYASGSYGAVLTSIQIRIEVYTPMATVAILLDSIVCAAESPVEVAVLVSYADPERARSYFREYGLLHFRQRPC